MKDVIKKYKNLSNEQKIALEWCMKRESVFITGGAGTGKSYLIRKIIDELEKNNLKILITASTGTAAYNINGRTVHNALGLKHKPEKNQMYTKEHIINSIDVIVIDEISMISCELFDIIYEGINEIRFKNKINKNIQYILVGDFLQLPPVDKNNKNIKFAFESKNWKKCINKIIELKLNFRNKNNIYLDILEKIRNGICTYEDEIFIKNLSKNSINYKEIIPTKIYITNREVNQENDNNLSKLKGKLYKYEMIYEKNYNIDDDDDNLNIKDLNDFLDNIINNCNIKCIDLKVGAQIIITRNISKDVYNGCRGIVIGFKQDYEIKNNNIPDWKKEKISKIYEFIKKNNNVLPIIKLENDKTFILEPISFIYDGMYDSYVDIIQLPIKLAYAMTVHKCQGMSINKCIIKLNGIFVSGQTFVALSRITNLDNMKVINFNRKKVYADEKCINFYKMINTKV